MENRSMLAALAAGVLLCASVSTALAESIDDFVGEYEGKSISKNGEGLEKRDLNVSIAAKDKGFLLGWTTIRHKKDGRTTKKTYKVEFIPTKRKNIYAAAEKTNVFGGRQPLDPLKGEPYTWARIEDRTLTVYTLLIDKEGEYEMQVTERTLTPEGLALKFERVHEGEVLRAINGRLERVNGEEERRRK